RGLTRRFGSRSALEDGDLAAWQVVSAFFDRARLLTHYGSLNRRGRTRAAGARLAHLARPFDTGRGCDRSADPDRPARPIAGPRQAACHAPDERGVSSVIEP